MSTLTKQSAKDLLREILQDLEITDGDIEVSAGMGKGDGYMSTLHKVDVVGINDKELHVMVKVAPKNETAREIFPVANIFKKEIFMYDQVFTTYDKFQKDIDDPFSAHVKCYKTINKEFEELLVLDNIKVKGFTMVHRNNPMDDDHLKLVLKEYGKLHAVGFALKAKRPELYKYLFENVKVIMSMRKSKVFNSLTMLFKYVQTLFLPHEDAKILEKLGKWNDRIVDILVAAIIQTADHPNGTIIHGDCWRNNMMFKYGDKANPKKPTSLCLLDFQLSIVALPVNDLSYFIYSSTSRDALNNLDEYLRYYHDSLSAHLKKFDCSADELYPFDLLKEHWKVYAKNGYIMSLAAMKIMFGSVASRVDIEECGDLGTVIDAHEADEELNAIYRDLTRHVCDIGVF